MISKFSDREVSMIKYAIVISLIISSLFLTLSIDENINLVKKNEVITKYGSRYIMDVNRNFLTFYSVIIFTCISGMFNIFQRLDRSYENKLNRMLLTSLYYILLSGGLISIRKGVSIYRYSAAITKYGPINETLQIFTKEFPTIIDSFILTPWSALIETMIITIFCFIFIGLIWNHNRDVIPKKTGRTV